VNDETVRAGAEATKEVAATTGKALDLAGKLSSYFDGMMRELGGIAEDNMKLRRYKNRLKLFAKAEEFMRDKGLDGPTREIPPKFALPLVTYATLEEDEGLQDIWARLLANAADASTPVELRTAYIDMLKDLTAFDVKILSMLAKLSVSDLPQPHPPSIETWDLPKDARVQTTLSGEAGLLAPEVSTSLSNLARAGCISPTYGYGGMPLLTLVSITPLGIGLYRACAG
jgi:hypothetical protein